MKVNCYGLSGIAVIIVCDYQYCADLLSHLIGVTCLLSQIISPPVVYRVKKKEQCDRIVCPLSPPPMFVIQSFSTHQQTRMYSTALGIDALD